MATLKIKTGTQEQILAGSSEEVEVTVRQTLADLYDSQTHGAGSQAVNAMMNATVTDISYYSSNEVGYISQVVSFVTQEMRDADPVINNFMTLYG